MEFDPSTAEPVTAVVEAGFDPETAKPVQTGEKVNEKYRNQFTIPEDEFKAASPIGRLKMMLSHPWDKYVASVDQGFKGIDIPRVEADQGTGFVNRAGQVGAALDNTVAGAAGGVVSPGGAAAIVSPGTVLYAAPRFVAGGIEHIVDAVKGAVSGEDNLQTTAEKAAGGALMLAGGAHGIKSGLKSSLAPKTPEQAIDLVKQEAANTTDPNAKAALEAAAVKISDSAEKGVAFDPESASPVAGPETTRLSSTADGAKKLEDIQAALKSPDTVIQYSVWDKEMLPPGADRTAQVDLINPKDTQSLGGIASTNRGLLQELGVDAPPAPDSLPPGRYTLDQIKEAIAAESAPKSETKTAKELISDILKKNPNADTTAPEQLLGDKNYQVAEVPLSEIGPVFGESTVQKNVVAKYMTTPSADPIVLARVDGVLRPVDGKHRLTAARNTGEETIRAYVPVDDPVVQKSAPQAQETASVGLGAASPKEFQPVRESATSLKNAAVDAERKARGAPPLMEVAKKGFGEVWDQAMKAIDENQNVADDLISTLKEKPRATTDVEQAILLHREIDLKNQLDKVTKNLAESIGTEDSLASDRLNRARILDELAALEDVSKSAGTETSRGLNARKLIAKEDYSLAKMLTDRRADKGGEPLTEKEIKETEDLHAKIEETQKAIDDQATGKEKITATDRVDSAVNDIVDRVSKETPEGERDLKSERAGIIDALNRMARENPEGNDAKLIQTLAENFVRDGITEREALVDAVHAAIKDVIPGGITRRQTMDAISGYGDFKQLDADAVKAQLRDLKGQMQQIGKLQDMESGKAPAKTGTERRTPSDEERRLIKQVEEAKRKGGFKVTDPATQLKTALASIKTRLGNEIRDLETQIATKTKIVKDKTKVGLDAEAEALKKQRDLLKEEFDKIFTKPGLTDAQRIALAEKSADRQIAELQRQLKDGDIFPKGKGEAGPTSAALEAKRAQIEALQEERQYARDSGIDPIIKIPKTPEEIALQAFKTRTAKQIADLQRRVAEGDFAPKSKPQSVQLDEVALRLKAENQRAKQAFQEALLKDRLSKRSALERAQDTFVKWRRGFLLSSPVTLAKLTSAAVQRMVFTPLEELVGAGIGKLTPKIESRAPREGGLNVNAEARAITEGITKGMSDAAELLRTGKTNLEVLFGKGREGGVKESDVTPRSIIDLFGQIHGALKAPVKRAEFARSLEKRMAWGIRNGVDVTDPEIQTKLLVQAYKDANRSIFLQDNIVVNAYNRALGALLEKQKSTGKPSTAGKILATTAKTLLPIVRVPTNIVAETIQVATGTITGSYRLARTFGRAAKNISPEEADLILRDLKKGSLGAALLAVGYFNAKNIGGYYQSGQKRSDKDVGYGSLKIDGVNIPSYLLHNPLIEALQIGATIRRVADSKFLKKDKDTQGIAAGTLAAALGLVEEVPFVRQQVETAKMLDTREGPYARGEFVKSLVVPSAVDFVARKMDTDAKGNPIQRKPSTVLQHIETGIPGLRTNVPTRAGGRQMGQPPPMLKK